MLSAWAEVANAPRVLMGRSSETRSASYTAGYGGFCGRCERPILVGQDIRFHTDFDGPVHNGCRPPRVTVSGTRAATSLSPRTTKTVTATRQPPLCRDCYTEHAGECW